MDCVFIETVLSDKICLPPCHVRDGISETLLDRLKSKYESVCTHHGYIKTNSIEIQHYSLGQIRTFSLNGDVVFIVVYKAHVCNPCIGSMVCATVVNMNKFGILAESLGVLEIVIPREDDVVEYKIGDQINVAIIGKKFEIGDTKLSIVGKVVMLKRDMNLKRPIKISIDNDTDDIVEGDVEGDVEGSDNETEIGNCTENDDTSESGAEDEDASASETGSDEINREEEDNDDDDDVDDDVEDEADVEDDDV